MPPPPSDAQAHTAGGWVEGFTLNNNKLSQITVGHMYIHHLTSMVLNMHHLFGDCVFESILCFYITIIKNYVVPLLRTSIWK